MNHLHHGAESGGGSTRVADLRDPHASIDPEPSTWNMWRSLSSIELGPAEIHRFVETRLGSARRVLEVGCGSGYLSLELARSGRGVVGLDPSADALAIARRTVQAATAPILGSLSTIQTTLEDWDAEAGSFDAAVFNLSLHHLVDLPGGLAKVRRLVARGGVLVVNDFGFDLIDDRTATWIVELEAVLSLPQSRWAEELSSAPEQLIGEFRRHWLEHFIEHELHRFAALRSALDRHFDQRLFNFNPYLFFRLANAVPAAPGARLEPHVRLLRGLEALRIEQGTIQPMGFRFIGTPR